MSLQEKYQPLSPPMSGECRPVRALQMATGRPVLIHFLPPAVETSGQSDLASLIFKFLHERQGGEGRHILDMGEDDGQTYVVTADVPQCLDLRTWLESAPGTRPRSVEDTEPFNRLPGRPSSQDTPQNTVDPSRQATCGSSAGLKPPVRPPERVPAAEFSQPRVPPAPRKGTDRKVTNFAGFWEGSSPGPAGSHSTIPSIPTLPRDTEIPSVLPEADSYVHDAPTMSMETLRAQREHRREPAVDVLGPPSSILSNRPEEGGSASPLTLQARDSTGTRMPEPMPQLESSPEALPSATLPLLTRLTPPAEIEGSQAELVGSPPPAFPPNQVTMPSSMVDRPGRKKLPPGFEVIYPSDQPRGHASLPNTPSAPMPGPAPTHPPVPYTPGGTLAGLPAIGVPAAPSVEWEEKGAGPDNYHPAWTPSFPQPADETEKPTRWAPAPSPPLPGSTVPGGYPVPGESSVPSNTPVPGRYRPRVEDARTLVSPVPPQDPQVPYAAAPSPDIPTPAQKQAMYLGTGVYYPPPQPQPRPPTRQAGSYAHGSWQPPSTRNQYAWVPFIILGGLGLLTLALILFFALKH